MRRTKIVCTLGPASRDERVIDQLVAAGMSVARLNFSHGTHDEHRELLARVRRVAEARGVPIAVLQDLQGPKIRVGRLPGGSLELERGAPVTIVTGAAASEPAPGEVPCTYPKLAADVAAALTGDDGEAPRRLLLDDGRLELRVELVEEDRLGCVVVTGGTLTDHKGINLPAVTLSTPALTDKDRRDLALGLELGVDFVALSFVRSAADCQQARELLDEETMLVAKIEMPEAVADAEAILEVADGIMVARGDLGVELGVERVPMAQKTLIDQANLRGRLVITATEMLDSMRHAPRPTRAEASDVANAILDGTDAVMLSGETASGDYPVLAVEVMGRIIEQAEASWRFSRAERVDGALLDFARLTHAVAHAAVVAARAIDAETIICFTESGASAVLTSEYRPEAQLLAVTHDPRVYHQLAMQWGVTPLLLPDPAPTAEATIDAICRLAREGGYCKRGEEVVITLGARADGTSDLMKIQRIA